MWKKGIWPKISRRGEKDMNHCKRRMGRNKGRSGRGRGSIGTPICYRSVNTQVIKSRIKDCTKELKIDAVTYSYTD